jgi:hypothetical protein
LKTDGSLWGTGWGYTGAFGNGYVPGSITWTRITY